MEEKTMTRSEMINFAKPEGKRWNVRVDFKRETYCPAELFTNVQDVSIGRDPWGRKSIDVDYIQHETKYKSKSCQYESIESVEYFLDSDDSYANDTWCNCVGVWRP